MRKQAISIIIPTLNEADNIALLFKRIDAALSKADIPYELVVVDDYSNDATMDIIESLAGNYDVRAVLKDGPRGKAYSLLQGFSMARHQIVCMIDADLQYPPEAIVPMYAKLISTQADVVISERVDNQTGFLRKLSSRIFNFIFAQLLFGISFDTQSGLKLFRKSILDDLVLTPSPWSFDLEFLVRALEKKRTIITHPINFSKREAGVTKVKLLSATLEIAKASLKLRFNSSIRKVRVGHRVNARFLKQAFPAGMILLLTLSVPLLLGTSHANALELRNPSTPVSQLQSLPAVEVGANAKPSNGTVTPEPAAPKQQVTPVQASSPVAAGSSLAATSSDGSSRDMAVASLTGNRNSTTTGTMPAALAYASSSPIDNSTLTAATALKPFSVYSAGYPVVSLDANHKRQVSLAATTAFLTGVVCIIAAILAKAPARSTLPGYQILQLSKIHRQPSLQ